MLEIFLISFYLIMPVGVIWLAKKVNFINKIGAVTVCYLIGILFGNMTGLTTPEDFRNPTPEEVALEGFLKSAMGGMIMIAIPLLLFSADFKVWRKLGMPLLKSFFLCVLAVTIAVVAGGYVFAGSDEDTWIHASMLMGVYTGGAPNLAAIGLALDVNNDDFLTLSAVEMLYGGIWLLTILTVLKPVLSRILKAPASDVFFIDYRLEENLHLKGSLLSFGVAAGMVLLALGLATIFFDVGDPVQESYFTTMAFLAVTTMGIGGAAVPAIRRLKGSYGLGNYFLLVFCVAVGSLANTKMIANAAPGILGLVAFVMFFSIILHLVLSWVFKVDVDTFIIASSAAIFGPPFIPPIAKAIKSPYMLPVGLALGVLGLAIGNYCGIAISHLLRHF